MEININEITIQEATKDLKTGLTKEEFLTITDLPVNIATIIYEAYRKGVEEYNDKYWNERSKNGKLMTRYTNLALEFADKVADRRSATEQFDDLIPF